MDYEQAAVGFLYQKAPKCASTTTASVNLRIARNVAKRKVNWTDDDDGTMCDNRWTHGRRSPLEEDYLKKFGKYGTRFRDRDPDRSFLWTILREPTSRYVSHFFYGPVTAGKAQPNLAEFRKWLDTWPRHFYNCVLSTQRRYECYSRREAKLSHEVAMRELAEIMANYDFIGVTERYTESLVVLGMLLDVPLGDLLFFSGKTSGSGFSPGHSYRSCSALATKTIDSEMSAFFQTDAWQQRVYYDELLYDAANLSLNMTIDRLGRDLVAERVETFQYAQQLVENHCKDQVVMPCKSIRTESNDSTVQQIPALLPDNETDCFYRDIGCGMDCLDAVARLVEQEEQP
jgi:hypothetical protein